MNISFLKLDTNLITDTNINANEFRIYTYLLSLYNQEKQCAYPSLETISTKLNISLSTVKRAIKHLAELGYISVEKKKAQIGNHNIYTRLKHLIGAKKTEITDIRTVEDIKEEKMDNHENVRLARKYVDVDKSMAIKEMLTLISKKNVREGIKNFNNKLDKGVWKKNTVSNLFREIIQVFYNLGEKMNYKVFNYYKKYFDIYAMQPYKRVDSDRNIPLDGQMDIDSFISGEEFGNSEYISANSDLEALFGI
ncbi:helix-turn-helix domain-containing protein [Clostridium perfringens]|uniref:helix-turn-helix domain-containing protein n=1 Tax=Clostridium perfringens TaxID=1502 RepID=UPI001A2E7BDF|nr:helix-turn-helix domain-containing protein [Clostridium perfringens]EIF6158367.1 helix-turn-helix domain-containing protein [Clostridium perfringens]EJT6478261.1 helix-turn-helix domain-containing protein [Clostridium perfringens]MDK0563080.1 helix-turn-helix domain-containing protein [Clostridium perfringens]MDK0662914.1 helix-turn-helix domain-containing protein [Clostridium perfringens]MDM0516873.1 helix-turn-helix domain-containing protein [Clostridium perfringens]